MSNNIDKNEEFSRRDFLNTAVVAGATLVGASTIVEAKETKHDYLFNDSHVH